MELQLEVVLQEVGALHLEKRMLEREIASLREQLNACRERAMKTEIPDPKEKAK